MQRRAFLLTALSASRVIGANDRVRVGLIGCGGRGRYVAKFMSESLNAQFVAFADVYERSAAEGKAWAGSDARHFTDFRKLLELKDVDAVQIATPDHWHAIIAVMACQAGKDAYVEKPICHHIAEGRAIVQAARRYNRIVFAGTQQRSAPHFAELASIVQGGGIGKVHLVRVWNFSNMLPDGIGRAPDSDPPSGLDWDMYLGPAPKVPYNVKRFQSTFRWFWDYAGGTITDFGTHRFDTVHQIMGADKPTSVSAVGGRYELKDAGEMPDTMEVTYEYPTFLMHYAMSNINSHGMGGRTPGMKYYHAMREDDRPHGMAFYGTQGTIFADRIGFDIYPEGDRHAANVERRHENTTDATSIHAKRFIDAVRNRTAYNADIEAGHRATTVALLGNVSLKTGLKLRWDSEKEVTDSAEANKLLRRQARKPWDSLA